MALHPAFAKEPELWRIRNRVDWAWASEPVSLAKLKHKLGRPHNAIEKVLEMVCGGGYAQSSK